MKITSVKSTIVAVPFGKVTPTSIAVFGDSPLPSVLIEISTDAGITGIGESPVVAGAEICKSIVDAATPLFIGEDSFHVDSLRMKLYAPFNLIHFHLHAASLAFGGLDTGLWDIVGKACGQSLSRLWGDGYRNKVKSGFRRQRFPKCKMKLNGMWNRVWTASTSRLDLQT